MMEYFLCSLAAIACVAWLMGVIMFFWIALGEPDVNGDPEKDGSGIDNLKPTKFYGEEWDEIERTKL